MGQFSANDSANVEVRGTCCKLRGYNRVKRSQPRSEAISFDAPAEIRKMLGHYHSGIVRDDLIPKYSQSAENPNYMVTLVGLHSKEECIDENKIKK